jgi:hypothetical protein
MGALVPNEAVVESATTDGFDRDDHTYVFFLAVQIYVEPAPASSVPL